MRLQSLVLCADEKILRVLRRVLSDLEIAVDHCAEADAAIHKLTRQRYEAVIVDCADERLASQVLRSARSAPCNKRAVAVAIIDPDKAVRGAFELGAHFVLYKPISAERAKTSFRAARALMKRERRRNTRIPVEIPVILTFPGTTPQRTVTSDVGEGGIAVRPAPSAKAGPMVVKFTLPGANYEVECTGEVAWSNSSRQAGICFSDLSAETTSQLKTWLESHAPELDKDDPPVPATLTDLSPGGGYLETGSPFPVRTKVVLSLGGASQVRAEGIVRVAHPEVGMGVEFIQRTASQREQLGKLIEALVSSQGATPEILVEPEGLEDEPVLASTLSPETDPLLGLFRTKAQLPTETFLIELRQQRGPRAPAPAGTTVTS